MPIYMLSQARALAINISMVFVVCQCIFWKKKKNILCASSCVAESEIKTDTLCVSLCVFECVLRTSRSKPVCYNYQRCEACCRVRITHTHTHTQTQTHTHTHTHTHTFFLLLPTQTKLVHTHACIHTNILVHKVVSTWENCLQSVQESKAVAFVSSRKAKLTKTSCCEAIFMPWESWGFSLADI